MKPVRSILVGPSGRTLVLALLGFTLLGGPEALWSQERGKPDPPLSGLTLIAAVEHFQHSGVPVFFSSALVSTSMVIAAEPEGTTPRERLESLLDPFGLALADGPRGRLIVVRARSESEVAVEPAKPHAITRDEIVVSTSRTQSRHGEPVAAQLLDLPPTPDLDLPHLGSDALRSVGLLPGVSTSESSAQPLVRGSRSDEVMVLLDGLELLAPYHLPEFDNALGIVSRETLDRVEVMSDPPPAEYGDRLGGVVDMTTRLPAADRLGASLTVGSLFGEIAAAGTFADTRGHWLGVARGGNYRLALEAGGRRQDPRYGDVFGKVGYSLQPNHSLQLRLLVAQDEFHLRDDGIAGSYRSRWGSSYLWLTHIGAWGGDRLVESMVWSGRIDRTRSADEALQRPIRFDLEDDRVLDVFGAKTVLRLAPVESPWSLDAGLELRQLHTTIDYRAEQRDMRLIGGGVPATTRRFEGHFDFGQAVAFASVRLRLLPELVVESGLRHDRFDETGDAHTSPRLHLAWSPTKDHDHVVRAAWGHYYQSQRPYELQVEDGETELSSAERSRQAMLSYEHRVESGASWRVGAFQRHIDRPRVRFESVFDTAELYSELAPSRIRLEPDAGRAVGLELAVGGAPHPVIGWSAAYTLASVADRVEGRWIPRATDETHALRLEAQYRLARGWTVSSVWLYHSGWPATSVEGLGVDTLGLDAPGDGIRFAALRAERLPVYHRLDLRLGRTWELRRGRLSAHLDIQNLYDRENVRGLDLELSLDGAGAPLVETVPVSWGGLVPSFAVRWSM